MLKNFDGILVMLPPKRQVKRVLEPLADTVRVSRTGLTATEIANKITQLYIGVLQEPSSSSNLQFTISS
jgi:hypothetical protein